MSTRTQLEQLIKDRIRQQLIELGGYKANGEPATEQDVERIFNNVVSRMTAGDFRRMARSKVGVILPNGQQSKISD